MPSPTPLRTPVGAAGAHHPAPGTPDTPGTPPDTQGAPAGQPPAASLVLQAIRALARSSRALERASDELSLAHYRVLAAIASGNERASRIAARLEVGRPAISATVDALCHRGLLERYEVAGDQRAAALHLTGEGEAVLARVEAEMVRWVEDLCTRVPDRGRMLEALVWLDGAIESARGARRSGDHETPA